MDTAKKNPMVLSYHETLLRGSDIELLRGPHWINDKIISFYFEFLERSQFERQARELLFVAPEVTQCIKLVSAAEVGLFLDPLLQGGGRDHIFFALNDHEHSDSVGGTHWSLLVYASPERRCYHFDSSAGVNQTQAQQFSKKLLRFLDYTVDEIRLRGACVEMPCLQQDNGYDCGIYVLCHAEHVAKHVLKRNHVHSFPLLSLSAVALKRDSILQLIYKLM